MLISLLLVNMPEIWSYAWNLLWLLPIFLATDWYAQSTGVYSTCGWNTNSGGTAGGGTNGTPANGDTVHANGFTINLDTTITGITFGSDTWYVGSGNTCVLTNCTFSGSLQISGGSITTQNNTFFYPVSMSGGAWTFQGNGTTCTFSSSGYITHTAGTITVNTGVTVSLAGSAASVCTAAWVINGQVISDASQAILQLDTGFTKSGTGSIRKRNSGSITGSADVTLYVSSGAGGMHSSSGGDMHGGMNG